MITRKIISISIRPQFHEAMKAIHKETRVNVSAQLDRMIEDWVEENRGVLRKYKIYLPYKDAQDYDF